MRNIFWGILFFPIFTYTQSNLLENPSFEGDFINTVPNSGEVFYQNPPPGWEEYKITNADDDERWLTDSVAHSVNPNLIIGPWNNGYFGPCGNNVWPLDSIGKTLMSASSGRFYVGFNLSNDGVREGF
ncbi:MAG TPA: hypothetical protein ENJ82_12820 [Bacteroidetes bacterium]|nr:hypothetical protein [Bacteroidota bacterium]